MAIETDPAKREELYDKACKLLAERGINVWYFQSLGMYPYRSNVENFEPWTSIEYTD
jgi:ABC-type transport system substrate-binding protein